MSRVAAEHLVLKYTRDHGLPGRRAVRVDDVRSGRLGAHVGDREGRRRAMTAAQNGTPPSTALRKDFAQ
jgi:hypothetical protein